MGEKPQGRDGGLMGILDDRMELLLFQVPQVDLLNTTRVVVVVVGGGCSSSGSSNGDGDGEVVSLSPPLVTIFFVKAWQCIHAL